MSDLYQQYVFLLQENCMTEMQKRQFSEVSPQMDDVTAQCALQDLAHYLYRFYGKKVILLLDEYDTPMQEAYVYGYWKNLHLLSEACLILHLRQIRTWNVQL